MRKHIFKEKSYIQNMSCRPRTQVHSKKMNLKYFPTKLYGAEISIDLECKIPARLKQWIKTNHSSRDFQIGALNAVLTKGTEITIPEYNEFYNQDRRNHEKELIQWLKTPTESIKKLPKVGVVINRMDKKNTDQYECELHTALYLVSHSTETLYLRNKSPLLSSLFKLITSEPTTEYQSGVIHYYFRKRVNIKFFNEGGLNERVN